MIYTDDLEDRVLNRHKLNGADELIFMGGYIGPDPVEKIARKINSQIKCEIIYNCSKNSNVNAVYHKKYVDITENTNVNVYYKNSYNHAKIYVWLKNKLPLEIMTGSANFSSSGLCNDGQEILIDIEKKEFTDVMNYVNTAFCDSQLCTKNKPFTTLSVNKKTKVHPNALDKIVKLNPPTAKIMLCDKVGHVHEKSGLNWGFGKAHIAKDCSYIAIRKQLIKDLPSLFPYNGKNPNKGVGQAKRNKRQIAEGVFDDGESIKLSFEGINPPDNFKQLTSFPKNNILGIYIRKRLGLNQFDQINYNHLKRYGRDNIEISKVGEGLYYLDFSV
jgi:hypothetical protein